MLVGARNLRNKMFTQQTLTAGEVAAQKRARDQRAKDPVPRADLISQQAQFGIAGERETGNVGVSNSGLSTKKHDSGSGGSVKQPQSKRPKPDG